MQYSCEISKYPKFKNNYFRCKHIIYIFFITQLSSQRITFVLIDLFIMCFFFLIQVLLLFPHKDFMASLSNKEHMRDDIALIQLKSDVLFSPTVSPICLWSGSANEHYIAEKIGMVI